MRFHTNLEFFGAEAWHFGPDRDRIVRFCDVEVNRM